MKDNLLPNSGWIKLNDWNTELWEIGTDVFDNFDKLENLSCKVKIHTKSEDASKLFIVQVDKKCSVNVIIDNLLAFLSDNKISINNLFMENINFEASSKEAEINLYELC